MTHPPYCLTQAPWAILPETLDELRGLLDARMTHGLPPRDSSGELERRKASLSAAVAGTVRRTDGVVMAGQVALVPVFGVLMHRVSAFEALLGGQSTEQLGSTLDSLVTDSGVRAVLMVFDSPGGMVSGTPELAARIRAARAAKPVVGIADSTAASAAYWLAAQTSPLYVTPSAQVGSVGIIYTHLDVSRAAEMAGVKTTLITSSPFKGELDPALPLSDGARQDLQAKVDQLHGVFVQDLAVGRGASVNRVQTSYGGGRMLLAQQALAAGMIDGIAALPQVVGQLVQSGGNLRVPSARQVAMAARLAQVRRECPEAFGDGPPPRPLSDYRPSAHPSPEEMRRRVCEIEEEEARRR